jgi:YggT family protein
VGGQYLTNPVEFLVGTLFGLYILAVMLRFLLQLNRADFYNPISQFLVKVTQPVLRPLRRVIPGLGGIDLAALLLMIALQLASLAIISSLRGGPVQLAPLTFIAIAELLRLLLNVYLFAIIIQIIISWVNPGSYNPALALIHSITEPVMRPARRLLPPMSGLDLSPIVVLIAIQLMKMLLLPPLYQLARAVA